MRIDVLVAPGVVRPADPQDRDRTSIFFASPNPSVIAALMSTVYEEQKDEDGFLYVQYSGESTFGM